MDIFRLLPADKAWIEQRLTALQADIKDLGPEFHEVLNQSSETWHDNAPFDAVRDKQSLLYAEYSHLKYVLLNSQRVAVQLGDEVAIGMHVSLTRNNKTSTYYIAGDWAHNAGQHTQSGALVITCKTPLAQAVLGKPIDTLTQYGRITALTSEA